MKSAAWTVRRRQHRSVGATMIFGLALLLSAILLMGLHAPPACANGDTLYVDGASGADTGNCRNPTAPAATIGYALTQVEDGDEIWVAEGTYMETFGIDSAVTLKGGYEAVGWTRDVAAHPTIIDANGADNSVITIYCAGAIATVEGFTIQGANHVSDNGGGLAIYSGDAIIRNSVIRDNSTDNSGGGIWVEMASNVSLINCTITGNVANRGGSGLGACCGTIHVIMRDTVFSENTGETVLGLGEGVTFEIIGGQVASNIIPGVPGSGSIWIGGSGTISGTAILSNTSDVMNVAPRGVVSAQNLTVRGNSRGIVNSGVLTITNSLIEDNGVEGWVVVGSANEGSPETNRLVMDGCTIRGNEMRSIMSIITGYAEIRDTKIVDNMVTESIGIIVIGEGEYTPTLKMVNVLLVDNETQGNPVLYGVSGSAVLMNVTVAGNNTGENHILFNGGGVIDATNIILWGNTTTAEEMIGSPPEWTTVSYSDIERGWAGTGNLNADPFFADVANGGSANGGYRLGARSPCIDRGTATGAPTGDIEGTLRDGFPDMGAYEWTGLRIYLPLAIKK